MGRFVPGKMPEIDRLIEDAIAKIGSAIVSLRIPHLAGVVLGGGYGRGEGGVFEVSGSGSQVSREPSAKPKTPETHDSKRETPTPKLSNDLDFYVVTDEGASESDIDRIGEMLKPISEEWTEKLCVDVDFCRAKTPWRLKHDEDRLMVQELVNGYVDVCGDKGESLFSSVKRLAPGELPWNEAARLLVNRGAGLLLAAEKSKASHAAQAPQTFINRNINKCVLGAGDARLIADGNYRWKISERAEALGDGLYSRAVEWKLHPLATAVCDWDTARKAWLEAFDAINGVHRPARSLYHAARWLARRKSLGALSTFGLDPEVRIMRAMRNVIERRAPFPPALKKDWMIFN